MSDLLDQSRSDATLGLTEDDWDRLLDHIENGTCLPFLGSRIGDNMNALYDAFPGSLGCYLRDKKNLARFVQYLSMQKDPFIVKTKIARLLRELPPPDFKDPNEPHRVLANMKALPLYMTTNYNSHMFLALQAQQNRKPRRDYCRWNRNLRLKADTIFDNPSDGQTNPEANPIVYHLHGHVDKPESLVISEDDYLDFIYNVARDNNVRDSTTRDPNARDVECIPIGIRQAIVEFPFLLFLGYRLTDWDFRVVMRTLIYPQIEKMQPGTTHMCVMIVPDDVETDDASRARIEEILDQFLLSNLRLKVVWKECETFIKELRQRAKDQRGIDL